MAHIPITEDTDRRNQYTVVGASSGPFIFDFPVFDVTTDLDVYITNAAGVVTLLAYGTGYTAVGNTTYTGGFDGGTVTLVAAVANSTVTIMGEGPYKRTSDFPTTGAFDVTSLNTDLDKLVVLCQQLKGLLRRAPVLGPASNLALVDLELPAPVAGKFIRWNLAANGLELADGLPAGPTGATGPSGTDDGNPNVIVNPNCAVAQLGVTVASVNDNQYCGDGMRVLSEANGDVIWDQSVAGFFPGIQATDKLTIATNNKKFGVFRPVEFKDLGKMLVTGQTVFAAVQMNASASIGNVKMAILAWTGTADAISADPISAWNADGVTPTLIANWAYCNTPVNMNVTPSIASYSVVGTVPSGAKNLALFIWNDDKVTTASDAMFLGEYQLQRGSTILPFQPIDFARNLARCQRYAAVFSAAGGATGLSMPGFVDTSTKAQCQLVLPQTLRAVPTGITVSNPTNFVARIKGASTVALTGLTFVSADLNRVTMDATVASGLTAGEGVAVRSNNVNCQIAVEARL